MKNLAWLGLSALLAVTPVFASPDDAPRNNKATFEQKKAAMLKKMDERMVKMQEGRKCLEAATTPEDAQKCKADHGGEMGRWREKN